MNKEFIPYGKALAIEELGYEGDDYIAVWYHSAVGNTLVLGGVINDHDKWCKVPALTYSQAFRWLYQQLNVEIGAMPIVGDEHIILSYLDNLINDLKRKNNV